MTAFAVPPEHPALPGHFPGRPVVPAVVLLDHVADAVLAANPGRHLAGIPAAKFLHPVLPGQTVHVTCTAAPDGRVAFACRVGQAEVARGTILVR